MKRALVAITIIAGILLLLLTPSVSFAHDWRPHRAWHGTVIVVERPYVVPSYAVPYGYATPYYGWHYDRWPGYVPRPYDPRYDSRDAYGTRGLIHRPTRGFGYYIGHW